MSQLTDDDIYTDVDPEGRSSSPYAKAQSRRSTRAMRSARAQAASAIAAARARHQRRRHAHADQHQLRLPQRRHAPALRLGQDFGRHRPRAFLAFRMARRSRPGRNGRRSDARLHRPLPDPPPDQGRHLGQHAEQRRRQFLGPADGVPLLESRPGEQGPETHLRNERLPDAHLSGEVHRLRQQRVPAGHLPAAHVGRRNLRIPGSRRQQCLRYLRSQLRQQERHRRSDRPREGELESADGRSGEPQSRRNAGVVRSLCQG